jgi:tRNA uridine 5-carboxymethylaminomethyl modification enzyme
MILKRDEAYIGVLIDDLITKGTEEPYRMFTSRAEYRILLRQDNADLRLTESGHKIGLASQERLENVQKKQKAVEELVHYFNHQSIAPEDVNANLRARQMSEIPQKVKINRLLKRPDISIIDLKDIHPEVFAHVSKYDKYVQEQAEILLKYESYIEKEQKLAEKQNNLENVKLRDTLDYRSIKALSAEARDKLSKIRPQTLGQATRISGISPADISVLMVYLD